MLGVPNLIVVHFKNGRLLKGYTHDFSLEKETFHLTSEEKRDRGIIYGIGLKELKAIFFVKTLKGDKNYTRKKNFDEVDTYRDQGLKVTVRFPDGETIRGLSIDYGKNKKGFFITPIDPEDNNESVYVLTHALRDVKVENDIK